MKMSNPAAAILIAILAQAPLAERAALLADAPPRAAEPEFSREPTWAIPAPEAVRRRVQDWFAGLPATEAVARGRAAWDRVQDPAAGVDPLDAAFEAVAAVDPRAASLREAVARQDESGVPAWLVESATPALPRDVVGLWIGRELVRQDRFDEALPFLLPLDVATSIDPATLLFCRAACQHWLLDADAALESLDLLLEREEEIPVRYARIARLLRADAAALEAESLDHIARRMRDVTRRLELGKAGPSTRQVQDGVIESLDKLIEKLEQQQKQSGGGGGGGAGAGDGGQPTGDAVPMDESRIAGGKGKGEVQKRDIGGEDGWGNLPPHQREEALQQIGREFPPHYREAIEQYFKRLAAGGEDR